MSPRFATNFFVWPGCSAVSLRCPRSAAIQPGPCLGRRSPPYGSPSRTTVRCYSRVAICARIDLVSQYWLGRPSSDASSSEPRFEAFLSFGSADSAGLRLAALLIYRVFPLFPLLRLPKLVVRLFSAPRSSRNDLSRHKARLIDPPRSGFDSCLHSSLLPGR